MEVSVVCLFRFKMKHSLRVQIFQSMSLIDEDELKRHFGVSESCLDWFVPCNSHLPPVSTQELLVLDDHLICRDNLVSDTLISFGKGCWTFGPVLQQERREWYLFHLESVSSC
jgi:hypothetical protein